MPATVCVTGASGFIGSHITALLLARGHRVRAAVRSPDADAKVGHLRALDGADRLELFRADLLDDGSFDGAVTGCDVVVHTAAAVQLAGKDPQRTIVDPSVRGTDNVLGSVARAGVKRLVHTSSLAAVVGRAEPGRVYTEADWNDEATLKSDPYGLAKTLAERRVEAFAEAEGVSVARMNPALVLGRPLAEGHTTASPDVVRALYDGQFPGCPKLKWGVVSVKDVAEAHVRAVEDPSLTGRFLLSGRALWMKEIAAVLAEAYPDRGIRLFELPNAVMYLAALFDPRLTVALMRKELDRPVELDVRRSREVLGIDYAPAEEAILETVRGLIDGGWVKP